MKSQGVSSICFLLLGICLASPNTVIAEEPPGEKSLPIKAPAQATVAEQDTATQLAAQIKGTGAGAVKPAGDSLDKVRAGCIEYLEKKGAGSEGFALIGGVAVEFVCKDATVAIAKGSANYVDARTLAYVQAFQDALGELANRRSLVVTKTVESILQRNTADQQALIDACKPGAEEQLGRKVLQLIDANLTGALKAAGAPSDTQAAMELPLKTCSNPILKRKIVQRINVVARASIFGVRVVQTMIDGDEVGVVIAVSPKNAEAARLLRGGSRAAVPMTDTVAGIRSAMGSLSETDLLATMGTRVIWMENGEPAILAFGMAGAGVRATDTGPLRSEHRRAAMAAAEQRAKGELATFSQVSTFFEEQQTEAASYGQVAKVQGDTHSEEETKDVGQELMQRISSTSTLQMTGAQIIRRWSVVDPISGDQVEGVILAWSPSLKSAVVSSGRSAADDTSATVAEGEHPILKSKDFKEDW